MQFLKNVKKELVSKITELKKLLVSFAAHAKQQLNRALQYFHQLSQSLKKHAKKAHHFAQSAKQYLTVGFNVLSQLTSYLVDGCFGGLFTAATCALGWYIAVGYIGQVFLPILYQMGISYTQLILGEMVAPALSYIGITPAWLLPEALATTAPYVMLGVPSAIFLYTPVQAFLTGTIGGQPTWLGQMKAAIELASPIAPYAGFIVALNYFSMAIMPALMLAGVIGTVLPIAVDLLQWLPTHPNKNKQQINPPDQEQDLDQEQEQQRKPREPFVPSFKRKRKTDPTLKQPTPATRKQPMRNARRKQKVS